jgi:hypothetical protein
LTDKCQPITNSLPAALLGGGAGGVSNCEKQQTNLPGNDTPGRFFLFQRFAQLIIHHLSFTIKNCVIFAAVL